MKRTLPRAERLTGISLAVIAAANVLFVLSFLAAILLVSHEARAEAPACTGRDLMAELETSDPAAFARIDAEAAATPNGDGLLWKIEKPGVQPSFLFGTMHLTDPRVIDLTPTARAAFDGSNTVVIETTEVLDQSEMMAAMMKRPELMMFTDGTTLTSLLSADEAAKVAAALDARGVPLASVQKMKPWMLAAVVAMPACEMARKASGAPFLDIKLAQDAKAEGKKLAGLETIAGQLEAMASLPMSFHMEGLVSTLELGPKIDDVFETMIVLYERGQIGKLWPLIRVVVPESDGGEGYAAFEEAMVTSRNRVMAANGAPFIDSGGAFIAVGALHLPGPDGVVELLRKAGYTVTPAG